MSTEARDIFASAALTGLLSNREQLKAIQKEATKLGRTEREVLVWHAFMLADEAMKHVDCGKIMAGQGAA